MPPTPDKLLAALDQFKAFFPNLYHDAPERLHSGLWQLMLCIPELNPATLPGLNDRPLWPTLSLGITADQSNCGEVMVYGVVLNRALHLDQAVRILKILVEKR